MGTHSDEKSETNDFEIKMRFNDRLVKKVEFLELTFENFKDCLNFSTKFRTSSNFAQFFDEPVKSIIPPKTLKPSKGGTHLIYDEKANEKPVSAKLPTSRLNSVTYKNYLTEGTGSKALDKRKTSLGMIRDREVAGNRSFY